MVPTPPAALVLADRLPAALASSVTVPLGLDLAAVAAGAVFGALLALRRALDITGVLGLAIVGGLGGGVVRDVLLDQPPVALADAAYLPTAIGAGLAVAPVGHALARVDRLLEVVDAFALGLFAIVGASKALDAGLGPVASATVGVVAATTGGIACDVLSGQRPHVLGPGPIYAWAAVAGSAAYVAVDELIGSVPLAVAAAMAATVVLRWLAIHRGLSTKPFAPAPPTGRRRAGR